MFISAIVVSEKKFSLICKIENPIGFAGRPKKWRKPRNEIGRNIVASRSSLAVSALETSRHPLPHSLQPRHQISAS